MNSNQLIKLESENYRLRRAVEELTILNEIATAINSSMSLDKMVDLIIQKCIKHLKVEQTAVMLLEKEQDENPFRTMIRRADTTTHMLPYRLNTQLTGFMLKNQKPLLPKSKSQKADEYIAEQRAWQTSVNRSRKRENEVVNTNYGKMTRKDFVDKAWPSTNDPNYTQKKKAAGHATMSKKEAKQRVKAKRKINSANYKKNK